MRREAAIHALKGLLEAGRESQIVTQGTSMEPFLKAGDVVQVEAVSPSQLKIGDLIAFLQGGNLIVHRFAGRVDQVGIQFLRQKGDNVRGHGLVHPEALVGRVAWTDRDGKRRFLLLGRGLAWNRLH
jgi:signal peptidase I